MEFLAAALKVDPWQLLSNQENSLLSLPSSLLSKTRIQEEHEMHADLGFIVGAGCWNSCLLFA